MAAYPSAKLRSAVVVAGMLPSKMNEQLMVSSDSAAWCWYSRATAASKRRPCLLPRAPLQCRSSAGSKLRPNGCKRSPRRSTSLHFITAIGGM